MAVMQRFLIGNDSRLKIMGGARFDPHGAVSPEWAPFGSYYMMMPAVELVRHPLYLSLLSLFARRSLSDCQAKAKMF